MRIPLAAVALALGSVFAVTALGWTTVGNAILETSYSRLNLIAETRREQIEDQMLQATDDLRTLSKDSRFTANANDLIASFASDPVEHRIIVTDFVKGATVDERMAIGDTATPTTYGRRHLKLHEAVRRLMEQRPYSDILILDDAGRIVYSAAKGSDFARSVEEPMFSGTSLPALFRDLRAADDRVILFKDVDAYLSGEEPAGFLAMPLLRPASVAMGTAQPDVRIGYLLVKFSSALFDRVSLRREGLGATGEILVTGTGGRLLNNPPSMRGMRAGSAVTDTVLPPALSIAGGQREFLVGGDMPTLEVATSVAFKGATWSIVVLQAKAEALGGLDALLWKLLIEGLLVALVAVAIAMRTTRALVRPLSDLTKALQRMVRQEWIEEIPGNGRGDEIGAIAQAVVGIRDVTAEKANADAERYRMVSEENHRLASLDMLTKLENRRGFFDEIDMRTEGLRAGGHCVAMLMDLDGFKQVNDAFGHAAGDRLLVEVASRLRRVFGPDALLARLGGDEFSAFFCDADEAAAVRWAKEAIEAVAAEVSVDRFATANIGVSIGIHCFRWGDVLVDQALHNADVALYAAKSAGKSTYRLYSETLEGERQRRNRLEAELKRSLEGGLGLSLHYQPIVKAGTRKVTSREALLRWTCPGLGVISPAVFIPIAEDSDLIRKIGPWVIQEACRDAATWSDRAPVAVNVSPAELGHGAIARAIVLALARSGLPPSRLEIEITETALLDRSAGCIAELLNIRALGVKIILDDFGVGFSSFANIRAFPFDKIKIDGSFVREAVERPDCAAVVEIIAELGKRLGIAIVAEGVETEAQFSFVAGIGCQEVQGYLIGRPAPSAEAPSPIDAEWPRALATLIA